MALIKMPYGRNHLDLELPDERIQALLRSRAHDYRAEGSESELVERALAAPIGSPPLRELARGRKKVVYLASDHTRPVPSRVIFPLMAREIEAAGAELSILVATGCHRPTSRAELEEKFGPGVIDRYPVFIHDCRDSETRLIGRLPSGGEFRLNRLAAEADLLVAEGFIEPHFFAGFSGGRKSVFPGVTDLAGVRYNHSSAFIAHPLARTGILDGNPIHQDMVQAAALAGLAFIVNTVIDADKKVIAAFAGHFDRAHRAGAAFLNRLAGVRAAPADLVVTTNGGHPLDQNLYQAVKGLTAAEASCRPGGVIIMAARAEDGHGGQDFFDTLSRPDLARQMEDILARGPAETRPDQWESQILIRILLKHRIILVTEAPRAMVEAMHMSWAPSLPEALKTAEVFLGRSGAPITVIPDGVGVIVRP